MAQFDIIVAADMESGIGKKGKLPWNLKGEMNYFRMITTSTYVKDRQNAVIMGRKTWESLPSKSRPLPGRVNIVLTSQEQMRLPPGVYSVRSFEEALALVNEKLFSVVEKIFVIGGESVYREALQHPDCNKIYLTRIFSKFGCDTFFPVDFNDLKMVHQSPISDHEKYQYVFITYKFDR